VTYGDSAGKDDVMSSWKLILEDVESISITVEDVNVHVQGSMAFVTCVERVLAEDQIGWVAATNIFELQQGTWRIIHHHGSQRPPKKS
jgi:ketosteroid isomerase-like protein